MCILVKKDLIERLDARRKERDYWGVMEGDLLLCAASVHVFSFCIF